MVWPHEAFGDAALAEAGPTGYVLVRDATCRLFGYHGLMDEAGGFSLDHMFGFLRTYRGRTSLTHPARSH